MTVALPLLPAGYRAVLHQRIGSTNDEAKALAREHAGAGTIVWAMEQTQGRGRRGRNWSSPPGNLYASFLLRPICAPEQAAELGFVAGLAVGDAIAELAPGMGPIACKWPNDVLIGGRKVAGILLEAETDRDKRLAFLIVGIGLNLTWAPSDSEFPATSIAAEGQLVPSPGRALELVASHFEHWTRRWCEEGFVPVRQAWLERAFALGEKICVRLETATLHGYFVGIDHHGALLIESGGKRRRIPAGDVFLAH